MAVMARRLSAYKQLTRTWTGQRERPRTRTGQKKKEKERERDTEKKREIEIDRGGREGTRDIYMQIGREEGEGGFNTRLTEYNTTRVCE
jgi:hypothetical protein